MILLRLETLKKQLFLNSRPSQRWGNQEPIWPINRAAISATPSPRVNELASPKKNFQSDARVSRPLWQYSCGRSSVLCNVDENALKATASARVDELARHKTFPQHTSNRHEYMFSCGRSSPIWEVSPSTLKSGASPRVELLAVHKSYPPEFQPEKTLPWEVSEAAKRNKPTERIETLSSPKLKPEGPFRDPKWPVSEVALNSVASQRCMELARAKSLADGFQPAKEIQWPVSRAALQASATERLNALAHPMQRTDMKILQYNPEAFKVKPQALKGQISARINELAQPINR
ncbi:unnamed protein product [Lymnaea stagnalis]|uniref:Testicular haploid expressed gene protein-like n=1 Tax=Lymnaea stagnalis TaxID=6523 RepID=A0AAV2HFY8_LYMST